MTKSTKSNDSNNSSQPTAKNLDANNWEKRVEIYIDFYTKWVTFNVVLMGGMGSALLSVEVFKISPYGWIGYVAIGFLVLACLVALGIQEDIARRFFLGRVEGLVKEVQPHPLFFKVLSRLTPKSRRKAFPKGETKLTFGRWHSAFIVLFGVLTGSGLITFAFFFFGVTLKILNS